MIEKIKAWGEASKAFLIWILTPLAFVAGFIYYLLTQNTELKRKASESDAEKKIEGLKVEAQDAEKGATDAETEYDRVRDAYTKQHGNGDNDVQ